jgi:guanosine-3',5'-bis(diphosphate) 3'-pyrophosphohydrolase
MNSFQLPSFSTFFATIATKSVIRNRELIRKAFDFAAAQHADQKRKFTGAPYFIHPVAVAQLLKLFADEVVIAGLLHDVIEDTDTTAEEVTAQFGSEVTFLVLGCTKDPTKQRTPLDILKDAATQDRRVIYIKLADRFDNLGDNILNMKPKTIRKYHNETPLLLDLAQSYGIDFLVEDIRSKLELIAEWVRTNEGH